MYGIVVVDSTMRLAMTPRMVLTGTVRSCWTGPLFARVPPAKVAAFPRTGDTPPPADADLRRAGWGGAGRTSALTIRPWGPEPVMRLASIFWSAAILRARG